MVTPDVEAKRPDKRWYVIHTYSGYENKVKANLEHRIESMGMEDKIFQVLVPMEDEIEIRQGQRHTVQKKVYPGYVLVENRDVDPDDEADREDEHGQVAHLVARRPRNLLQLGPDLVEVSANAGHVCWSSLGLREVAGAIGLEPTTAGFGDQCSAN